MGSFAYEYISWINKNVNIEDAIKSCSTCIDFQGHMTKGQNNGTQNTGKTMRSSEADIFTVNNKHYLCIVHYPSQISVMKQVEGCSTDNFIKSCKVISSEYSLASKIVSLTGTKFISEKLKEYCK